jgi:hypothetical protein
MRTRPSEISHPTDFGHRWRWFHLRARRIPMAEAIAD